MRGQEPVPPLRKHSLPSRGHRPLASRSALLVGISLLLAALLVGSYLAAGGASYEPAAVQDPCEPREWRGPDGIEQIAEQFSLSALDGAACRLGVSRERLTRALGTEETREDFARAYGIEDAELEEAVRAGLLRAIEDAERAGALNPLIAAGLRSVAERVPVEEGIALIEDARPLLEGAQNLLGDTGGLIEQAEDVLGEELDGLLP